MPKYVITGPDGQKYEVTGKGSEQEALEHIKNKVGGYTSKGVPTQRTRTALQGVTLGFADEAEAAIRAPFSNRSYGEIRDEVRGGLNAYKADRPWEALAYEAGGAVLPGVLAAPVTGGTSTVATLGRMAKLGAVEGAAYAYGTGEEGALEDLKRVPSGAATGAVVAPAAGAAFMGLGKLGKGVINSAKRKFGNKGASIVEAELRRMREESGMSIDDIVQGVRDGKIMAENRTLTDAIRGRIQVPGGEGSSKLATQLPQRVAKTRNKALDRIQNVLDSGSDSNIVRRVRKDDKLVKELENQAYKPFKSIPLDDEGMDALADAIKRVPSSTDEVAMAVRAETGGKPFYTINKKGEVKFTRRPTVEEAEGVRRAISNRVTNLFKGSKGNAASKIDDVEKELRRYLDDTYDDLKTTRQNAAKIRGMRDAYKEGQQAVNKGIDDVESYIEDQIAGDDALLAAYRDGYVTNMRKKAGKSSGKSMMTRMSWEDGDERKVLSELLPSNQSDDVLKSVDLAADSQAASNKILGGSDTARSAAEAARPVSELPGAYEVAAATKGSVPAIVNISMKLIQRLKPELNSAQRGQVADILLSESPDVVERALRDASGLDALTAAINQTTQKLGYATGSVGAGLGGGLLADELQPRKPLTLNINKPLP